MKYTEIKFQNLCKTSMGQKDVKTSQFLFKLHNQSKREGTKKGYVSGIRQWIQYNAQLGLNPFHMPMRLDTVVYWLANRVEIKGISTLNRNIACLLWLSDCLNATTEWHKSTIFKNTMYQLQKQYKYEPQKRLPITIDIILRWTKLSDINIYKVNNINWNKFVKVLILQLYWFTASRPMELLPYKNKMNENGLRVQDIKYVKETDRKYWSIRINYAKNLRSKKTPKIIYLGRSKCKNSNEVCKCYHLDPAKLLKIYLLMIQERAKTDKRFKLKKDDFIFKWNDSTSITVSDLTDMTREMIHRTIKTEKERYTSYSLRIGGTTEMAKANIQLTKIYRYIGWSQNALPLIMDRYVRFTVEQLIEIPHDMIHNKKPTAEGFVFDPWDESNKR